jgi:hypothetical protein
MIGLEPHAEGTVLPVRAHPGARRNAVRGEHDGALRVSVTQAPDKGKANKAIAELLSRALGLPRSQIELLSGATSPRKRFLVRGVRPEELSPRIARALQTLSE